jgi:hypothetical protein
MVWSYQEYKQDEHDIFTTLFKMAGQPPESPVTFQTLHAIDIICQGEIAAPRSLREALRRVIRARECATKFYTRIQSADTGHENWLRVLRNILDRLDQHAAIVRSRHLYQIPLSSI